MIRSTNSNRHLLQTNSHDDAVAGSAEISRLFDHRSSSVDRQPTAAVNHGIVDDSASRLRRSIFFEALSNITVEPALFLYAFAFAIYSPVYGYMMMNKLCLQYCGYTTEQCSAYGTGKNATVDTNVQKIWAQFDNYSTIISTFPSVIFALFMGPWSDVFGRKTPMAVPFIGTILASVFTMLLYFVPSLSLWVLFLPQLMHSCMGGLTSLLTGAFAYAADISLHDERASDSRTIRITLIEISMAIGFAIAGILSGILIAQGVEYYVCYLISFVAALLGFLYVLIRIRETRRPERVHTPYEAVSRLFRLNNLAASCRTFAQRRPSIGPHARRNLLLLLAAITIYLTIFMGELQINQKFFLASPLRWSLAFYVSYSSTWTFISMIFIGIFIGVTKKALNWRDTTVGILGCVSRIAYSYVISIASATWMVYLASTVGVLKFMPVIAMRTLMSKLVPKDEQGRVFSFLAAFEALTPLVGSTLMTAIFTASAATWPGFFSLVAGFSSLVPMVLLVLVDYYMRCDEQLMQKRNDDGEEVDADGDARSCATVEEVDVLAAQRSVGLE